MPDPEKLNRTTGNPSRAKDSANQGKKAQSLKPRDPWAITTGRPLIFSGRVKVPQISRFSTLSMQKSTVFNRALFLFQKVPDLGQQLLLFGRRGRSFGGLAIQGIDDLHDDEYRESDDPEIDQGLDEV